MAPKEFLIIAFLGMLALSGCLEQPVSEEADFMTADDDEPLNLAIVDDVGIESNNQAPIPGNCDNVESQHGKDQCWFNSAIEDLDTSFCMVISELWMKNNCIIGVAAEAVDPSVCDDVKSAFGEDNTSVKNQCIAKAAKGVLYTDECRGLSPEGWETICWGEVERICSTISDIRWMETCIKHSAIDSGFLEKCFELHGFEKDTCLMEIGAARQDESICMQIEDESSKQSCLDRMGAGNVY